jgi:aldose 1-epimerase
VISPSGEQIEVAAGDLRAVVVEVGGGLRSLAFEGRAILDDYPADRMCSSGRGQVLLPWPNRLDAGSYEFAGRGLQLPLTEVENGTAIHGLVRWANWSLRERELHRVVMEHVLHPQPGYPFTLDVRVEYASPTMGSR